MGSNFTIDIDRSVKPKLFLKFEETLIQNLAMKDVDQSIRDYYYSSVQIGSIGEIPFAEYLGYKYSSFSEYVGNVMDRFFDGKTSKKDFQAIVRKTLTHFKRQRRSFAEYIVQKIENYDVYSPLSPMYGLIPDKSHQNSVRSIKDEYIIALNKWVDSNEYFIQCPLFLFASKTLVRGGFRTDVFCSICHHIKNFSNGSLEQYFLSLSKDFIEKLSPISFLPTLFVNEEGKESYVNCDEEGNIILRATCEELEDGEPKPCVLSAGAKTLYTKMIEFIPSDAEAFATFRLSRTIRVNKYALAATFNDNPNVAAISKLEEYLRELYAWSFDSSYDHYRLLSRYKDEGMEYTIVFSDISVDKIIERSFISVRREDYDKLNKPLSKILIHYFKWKQLELYPYETSYNGYVEVPYGVFLGNVNFPTDEKEENLPLIEASLMEFRRKGIILDSYYYKNGCHYIHFLPPSAEEITEYRQRFGVGLIGKEED